MTPPTQQELEALRRAAKKVQALLRSANLRQFNDALDDFHYLAHLPVVIAMVDLIAARDKEIAELKAQVGHAREIGVPDDGVMM